MWRLRLEVGGGVALTTSATMTSLMAYRVICDVMATCWWRADAQREAVWLHDHMHMASIKKWDRACTK